MVAKAATRAGEYFCFHCGKQVEREDLLCKGCGLNFHKVIRAFRCPRCAKILPSGAVVCPACGLGFKIKSTSSTQDMSKDEEILVDLIDNDKQPQEPASDTPAVVQPEPDMAQPAAEPEPSPEVEPEVVHIRIESEENVAEAPKETPQAEAEPPKEGEKALFVKLDEAEADVINTVDRNKKLLEEAKEQEAGTVAQSKSQEEVNLLYHRLMSGVQDMERLESKINQLAYDIRIVLAKKEAAARAAQQSQPLEGGRRGGLSNIALKRLLEEREREVSQLREREADMVRREEHINHLVREYAAKKKELDSLRNKGQVSVRDASETARSTEETIHLSDFPSHLDVEDRNEWLREQSRIKDGLIEIRNEIGSKGSGTGHFSQHISSEVMEKIEVLEERLVDSKRERDELLAKLKASEETMNDTKAVLVVLDQLLGKLPPEIVDEFSKSADFKRYERILERLNI